MSAATSAHESMLRSVVQIAFRSLVMAPTLDCSHVQARPSRGKHRGHTDPEMKKMAMAFKLFQSVEDGNVEKPEDQLEELLQYFSKQIGATGMDMVSLTLLEIVSDVDQGVIDDMMPMLHDLFLNSCPSPSPSPSPSPVPRTSSWAVRVKVAIVNASLLPCLFSCMAQSSSKVKAAIVARW